MRFDQKICYFHDMEKGVYHGCVGFLKIELRNEKCNIILQIQSGPGLDTIPKKVLLIGEQSQKELCEIVFVHGKGRVERMGLAENNLGGSQIGYGELQEILIPVSSSRVFRCVVRKEKSGRREDMARENEEKEKSGMQRELPQENEKGERKNHFEERLPKVEESKQEVVTKELEEAIAVNQKILEGEEEKKEENLEEKTEVGKELLQDEEVRIKEIEFRTEEQEKEERKLQKENWEDEERKPEIVAESMEDGDIPAKFERPEKEARQEKKERSMERMKESSLEPSWKTKKMVEHYPVSKSLEEMGFREDKWEQLAQVYPHVKPFRDERDYLSVGPGDFVVFTEKYYPLVSNSFLLHGYYNYRHLVLAKKEVGGRTEHYIGVPGTFYEREKQVAVLFGFESFECSREPAKRGDYGYYMMRVEL